MYLCDLQYSVSMLSDELSVDVTLTFSLIHTIFGFSYLVGGQICSTLHLSRR